MREATCRREDLGRFHLESIVDNRFCPLKQPFSSGKLLLYSGDEFQENSRPHLETGNL